MEYEFQKSPIWGLIVVLVFNNLSEKIISVNFKTENRSIKGDK